MGIKEVIYDDTFESPDLIQFPAGMWSLKLQRAPPHQYGTLVSILYPLVALEAIIQQVTQLVADLRETERLQTRHNNDTLEGAEVLPITKTRRPTPQTSQSASI